MRDKLGAPVPIYETNLYSFRFIKVIGKSLFIFQIVLFWKCQNVSYYLLAYMENKILAQAWA